MGFLDRFKKDKRKQVAPKTAKVVMPEKKAEAKKEALKEKIAEKQQEKKEVTERIAGKADLGYGILLHPLLSEKAASAESRGVYTFIVGKNANKIQIKQAIAAVYKVKPVKIRVVNINGKITRQGRSSGRRSDWKKAIITLSKGQSINIHEGV
mgnify:CR=1 FL=1